jgi:hypothetical protein
VFTDTGTIVGTLSSPPASTTITDPDNPHSLTTPTSAYTTSTTSATLTALPAPEGASQPPPSTTTTNPSGKIAGAAIGSVAGLVALGVLSRWVWKRGAGERAVQRMYRQDMREVKERAYGLEEGPGQWGRPAWRRAGGSSEGH